MAVQRDKGKMSAGDWKNSGKRLWGNRIKSGKADAGVSVNRKRDGQGRAAARGSYTVEASLLMGIILPVLVSVLYLGFFLHDLGFLQGAAHEAACAASLGADGENTDLSSRAATLIAGRLLGMPGGSLSLEAGKKEVKVTGKGIVCLPGMAQIFFGRSQIQTEVQVAITTECPTKKIQTLRSIAKTVKKIQGGNGE